MEKKLEKSMQEQIKKEFYSAYLYLSMAAYFESKGLSGMSSWMQKQAQEELFHGMKFFTFLNDRGTRVVLEAIDKPTANFSSVRKVFEETLKHEKLVTASINNLYSLAQKANDTAALMFLSWFITEQVEEEKAPSDILAKLDYIKEDSTGIVILDKELGARPQPVFDQTAE